MGMGLGHNYLVQIVNLFSGDLKECIDFMKSIKPNLENWFELTPDIKVIKGHAIHTGKYRVFLLKDGKQ